MPTAITRPPHQWTAFTSRAVRFAPGEILVRVGDAADSAYVIIEGEVEMDSNHALEDYEVAAGYVLSCQAFPISDKVVLDFDQL